MDHSACRFALVGAWRSEGASDLEIAAMLLSCEVEFAGSFVKYSFVTGVDGSKRLVQAKPSAGEFDTRSIARDLSRAHVYKDHSEAFGSVDDHEYSATIRMRTARQSR